MKATFDPAKNLDLYFRKYRDGSKTFIFKDAAGDPYDLSGLEFRFVSGFAMTLTVDEDEILFEITEAQAAVKRDSFYWELYNVTSKKTWLCGTAYFTEALSAQVNDSEEITIDLEGETVEVTIVESGGESSFKGSYDASSGDYPTDAALLDGDYLRVSVEGILEVTGVGLVTVYPGALLFSLTDNPGNVAANWKVIQ